MPPERKRQQEPQDSAPKRLLNIRTLQHLALRLNLPLRILESLAEDTASHYKPLPPVPKKGGGTRTIEPPRHLLKHVQRQIHATLLARLWLPDEIHAYRPRRSVQTAIEPHLRKPFLWVADIRNFYPSISAVRVYKMFCQLGCTPEISKLLTRLTTHRHRLPQGAPTSPTLANLYLHFSGLASRLSGLAKQHGLDLTYFGDDILVSSNSPFMHLAPHLAKIIKQSGLSLHPKKTRSVAGPFDRHEALGVVMDPRSGQIDIPKSYRRKLKALLRLCRRHGPGVLAACGITHKDPKAYLSGKIAYAVRVNPKNGILQKCLDEIDWRAASRKQTIRRIVRTQARPWTRNFSPQDRSKE